MTARVESDTCSAASATRSNFSASPGLWAVISRLLAAAAVVEQSGVLDSDTRRSSQGDGEVLVLGGKVLPAGFLRQIQVSEHGLADPDRNPEERLHGGMIRWKA